MVLSVCVCACVFPYLSSSLLLILDCWRLQCNNIGPCFFFFTVVLLLLGIPRVRVGACLYACGKWFPSAVPTVCVAAHSENLAIAEEEGVLSPFFFLGEGWKRRRSQMRAPSIFAEKPRTPACLSVYFVFLSLFLFFFRWASVLSP